MSEAHYNAERVYRPPGAAFENPELERYGVSRDRLTALYGRAAKDVDEGLLPAAQLAVAKGGQLLALRAFGSATTASRFSIFSATKAITCSAIWQLLDAGSLRLEDKVVEHLPEFDSHGKGSVTVVQLLTHTAGFPHAPFRPEDWDDKERRYGRFQQWRLTWEPGSRFEYHPTATLWVLAELIERCCAADFREVLRQRVLDPLGLPTFRVGLAPSLGGPVIPCEAVGELLCAADYARLGLPEPPESEVTEEVLLKFNHPAVRAVGVPGGGGVCGAGELALFYQALLPGGAGEELWSKEILEQARTVYSGSFKDPVFQQLANRTLGLVLAGDERRTFRGFGRACSPLTFGHNGAGGQLAWADPATGLSFVYLTSGHDRNPVRQAARGAALSDLAASLMA